MALQLGPRHAPPPQPRTRGLVTGLGSLVLLAAVVGGLPWALLRFTEWPVTGVPTAEQLRDIPATVASEQTIIAVLVVGLWLAWLAFTTSVALEAVAHIRGHDVPRMPGAAPVQLAARNLVAAVVMAVGTLGSATVNAAKPGPELIAATTQPTLALPAATATPAPPLARPSNDLDWQLVTVDDGDTAWALAKMHYGDGAETRRLWLDNRDRIQPDGTRWANEGDPIETGWLLRVRPVGYQPTPQPQPTTDAPSLSAISVEPGDNLWTIAEDELAERVGHDPAPPETRPFWQRTIDLNRPTLRSGDPDLIYPGEQIELPSDPPAVETPAPAPMPSSPPLPPARDPTVPSPTTVPPPSTTSTSSVPTPTAADAPSPTGGPPETGTDLSEADDLDSDDDRTTVAITAAATVAGLALAALARRRRARRRSVKRDTTAGPRPADDVDTERSLAIAADDVLSTAQRVVNAFGNALQASTETPNVAGIVIDSDGEVTLHITSPIPPVHPFLTSPAGPSAWRFSAGPDQEPEGEAQVPVLETVVALGRTADGNHVLVDLESLGAISIEGHHGHAAQLARSVAAELALQPVDHYVDVTVAGQLDILHTTEQGAVKAETLDENLTRIHEQHGYDTARWIADEGYTTTTAARAHGLPRDGLVVAALIAGPDTDPVLLNRLAEAAAPGGHGLAVVSLTPLEPPATQLIVADDGTLEVPHLGLTITAAQLAPDDLQRIDDLLDHEPTTVTELPRRSRPAPPTEDAGPYNEPDWSHCVRVFAHLTVHTTNGEPVSFRYGENPSVTHKNTHRGPELLAYLALRPDRSATRDEVREHLWWKRSISTRSVDTLIGGTRKVLGGADHLSVAQGQPGHRRYHLAPTVVTDVELLEHAIAYAHTTNDPDAALAALRSALEHIQAPAFQEGHQGDGLAEWANAYRITDRAEQAVIDAALIAVDLLRNRGAEAIPDAQDLVDRALRACPTNEALIRAAMELDARTGHRDAAQARYKALATRLELDDLEPEAETTDLRAEIMSPNYRIG